MTTLSRQLRSTALAAIFALVPTVAASAQVAGASDVVDQASCDEPASAVIQGLPIGDCEAGPAVDGPFDEGRDTEAPSDPGLGPGALKDPPEIPLVPKVVRGSRGRRVLETGAPWQAQLYQPWSKEALDAGGIGLGKPLWERRNLCGGSLIDRDENWVLTAAHCFANEDSRRGYRVRLGSKNIAGDNGVTYRIDCVIRHPGYVEPAREPEPRPRPANWKPRPAKPALHYDIALLHFRADDKTATTPPAAPIAEIKLDSSPPPQEDDRVFATGWGRTSNTSPTARLMQIDLKHIGVDRCSKLWKLRPNPGVVCAGGVAGRQTCQKDSGGPLVNARGAPRLIGVVSWNNADCAGDPGKPGVYTRVAAYRSWIDQTRQAYRRLVPPHCAGPAAEVQQRRSGS